MKKMWIAIAVVVAVGGLWTINKISHRQDAKEKAAFSQGKDANYWTCPMHPQIHMDHAGECPICHMKLIQVKEQQAQAAPSNRASVMVTADQLGLIGIQKQEVERMDLAVSIPVAGRLISASSVAFQVYESDLKYIKSGLPFRGSSSLAEEGELSGHITSVDSIVDPTSRTVRVVGSLLQSPKGLIAETTFSGAVIVTLKDRISIPESAVLHTGTDDLVYLFGEGNRLTPQVVKLGLKSEGFYEVLSGLTAGQVISSGPNFLIDSEAKIRGISEQAVGDGKSASPSCPSDQHWDIPMAMCMPGKAQK